MKKLLSLKHWQLFLLIVICGAWTSPSPLKELINGIAVATFTLWIYAVGVCGQKRITELGLKPMNLRQFKTNVIVTGCLFFFCLVLSAMFEATDQTDANPFGISNILGAVAGIYLIFTLFQTTIFVCKTISKIELRREVSFDDYAKNLFCIVFFFVGVWLLQPKINRLIVEEEVAL